MLTKNEFNILLAKSDNDNPYVTIYVPTYRAGNSQEDHIRFKNALGAAVEQLCDPRTVKDYGMIKKDATKYLRPAYDLLDRENFWNYLSDGLAVFIGPDHFSYHIVPIDFTPTVIVHNRFYLRSLLPLLNPEHRFFVLALSQNEVRFFEGNKTSITPVQVDDLVPNGQEELIETSDRATHLQSHSTGGAGAVYHGQGGGKDNKLSTLKKYFRRVDEGLMKMLHDEQVPLIIYSVDHQIPIYKEVSSYQHIYDRHISGNPENEDPVIIHEKAWEVIKDYFSIEKESRVNQFPEQLAKGNASISIHDILPAAVEGRVDTLFVDKDEAVVWGGYDEATNTIQIHQERQADSICLLEKIAIAAYENGSKVYNISRTAFPNIITYVNGIYRY